MVQAWDLVQHGKGLCRSATSLIHAYPKVHGICENCALVDFHRTLTDLLFVLWGTAGTTFCSIRC